MYYPLLTTLDNLKTFDLSTTQTADDNKLARFVFVAGQTFTQLVGSKIAPYKDTKYYNHPYPQQNVLYLNDNLLELIELKTQGGDITLLNSDIILKCGDNPNLSPYDKLEIKTTSDNVFFEIGLTSQNSNSVNGVWGWHDDIENLWVNTNDTVVSSTSTTITVNSATGLNEQFDTRFQKLQLCKVVQGDSFEFFIVNSISGNVLTVRRAINGTSQLTLVGSEVIYTYNPPYDIEQAVRRLASWYYRSKDASRADLDRPIISAVGVVMPPHLPKDVLELAVALRNPFRG